MNEDLYLIVHRYPASIEIKLSIPLPYFNFDGRADEHIRFLLRAHPWLLPYFPLWKLLADDDDGDDSDPIPF